MVGDGRDPETLRVFWQNQWDRIGRLEDQRLQFSNFVIAASVVSLGLNLAADSLSAWTYALVAATVAVSNLVAARYTYRAEIWVRMHRRRSDLLIDENWSYLADLRQRAGKPEISSFFDASKLHLGLHILLSAAAIGITGLIALS